MDVWRRILVNLGIYYCPSTFASKEILGSLQGNSGESTPLSLSKYPFHTNIYPLSWSISTSKALVYQDLLLYESPSGIKRISYILIFLYPLVSFTSYKIVLYIIWRNSLTIKTSNYLKNLLKKDLENIVSSEWTFANFHTKIHWCIELYFSMRIRPDWGNKLSKSCNTHATFCKFPPTLYFSTPLHLLLSHAFTVCITKDSSVHMDSKLDPGEDVIG